MQLRSTAREVAKVGEDSSAVIMRMREEHVYYSSFDPPSSDQYTRDQRCNMRETNVCL